MKKQIKLNKQYQLFRTLNFFYQNGYSLNETLNLINSELSLKLQEYLKTGGKVYLFFENLAFISEVLTIIKISEETTNLKIGFVGAEKILANKIKVREEIIEELRYPFLIVIILTVCVIFLSNFLLPQFITIYNSLNVKLSSRFYLGYYTLKYLPLTLLALGLILTLIVKKLPAKLKIRIIHVVKYKIFRKLTKRRYHLVFINNLVTFLNLNLTLKESLVILSVSSSDSLLKEEAIRINEKLKCGSTFSESLSSYYYDNLKLIIKQGERTKFMTKYLEDYLVYLNLENKKKHSLFLMLLQPAIYIVFGAIIIGLYIAIFWPIYQLMDTL